MHLLPPPMDGRDANVLRASGHNVLRAAIRNCPDLISLTQFFLDLLEDELGFFSENVCMRMLHLAIIWRLCTTAAAILCDALPAGCGKRECAGQTCSDCARNAHILKSMHHLPRPANCKARAAGCAADSPSCSTLPPGLRRGCCPHHGRRAWLLLGKPSTLPAPANCQLSPPNPLYPVTHVRLHCKTNSSFASQPPTRTHARTRARTQSRTHTNPTNTPIPAQASRRATIRRGYS